MTAIVPLTAIAQASQEIKVLCLSTNEQTQQWRRGESGSNRLYKCLGYKASFLPILEQRVEIAISLCRPFAQLLTIQLANMCVPDSLTKTPKILKPVFGTAL